MQKVFSFLGGRKNTAMLLGAVLIVLNDIVGLGMSEETIQSLAIIIVGGSAAIALEDGLKKKSTKKGAAK